MLVAVSGTLFAAKPLWNADPFMSKGTLSMTVISFALRLWKQSGTGRLPPNMPHLKSVRTLNASPREENNKKAAMIVFTVMAVFSFPAITGGDSNVRAG